MRVETPRLSLREWRDEDLEPLHRDVLGNEQCMEFSAGAYTLDGTRDWIELKRRLLAERGYAHLAVERKDDGRMIGVCGIALQALPEGKFLEVGYRLAPDVWGNGYATEAARASVEAMFDSDVPCGRMIAIIEQANVRSVRVAKKLGMNVEWKTTYFERDVDIYSVDNPKGGDRGPF